MKILCILDNCSIASGVSSIVMNLYRNMDFKRIQMDFMVCVKMSDSYENEIRKLGGKVFYIGKILSIRHGLQSILKIKKFFYKHGQDYDIVHLHVPSIAPFTLSYAKKHGIPIRIVHSHSTMMSTNKLKNVMHNFLTSQIKKYANVYFACSTEAAYFLYGKSFCKENPIEIIHNAVDCSKFFYNEQISKEIRKELNVDEHIIFAHVSNYTPIKNHFFLLDVIEKFSKSDKKVKFLFVGDGINRQSFQEQIIQRKLNNLCIFIDRTADVAKYLFVADAVILPSIKEGLGMVLVEGQASGLPFFASDAITKEVKVGEGFFIPLNVDEWYKKLNAFQPVSTNERIYNSGNFRSSVYNICIEAKRVTDIYERLLKRD